MIDDLTMRFLLESNKIEGITGVSLEVETAADQFLSLPEICASDVVEFVAACQPDAVLRTEPHLNVRVGNHIAPRGGPEIKSALEKLLERVNNYSDPYGVHVYYETLHPFTDGNGRSGRIIWLWMMNQRGGAPLGFLHHFYYQALAASRVTV